MFEKNCLCVVIILAYLIGSVNVSIIISKIFGADIREYGSGNAGATNMLRTYGKKVGVIVLLLDAAKGVLAVGLGMILQHIFKEYGIENGVTASFKYFAALGVVVGHNYPVYFGFRGGKGIATSAAVMFMLDWRVGLVVLVGALIIMVFTRYVSLGSICGAVLYIFAPLFFTYVVDKTENNVFIIISTLLALLAVYRHKDNIVRLYNGTESKLGKKSEHKEK